MNDTDCRICGTEIETKTWDKYTAEEKEVCTDCWFGELSGEERKEIAERANRSHQQGKT